MDGNTGGMGGALEGVGLGTGVEHRCGIMALIWRGDGDTCIGLEMSSCGSSCCAWVLRCGSSDSS